MHLASFNTRCFPKDPESNYIKLTPSPSDKFATPLKSRHLSRTKKKGFFSPPVHIPCINRKNTKRIKPIVPATSPWPRDFSRPCVTATGQWLGGGKLRCLEIFSITHISLLWWLNHPIIRYTVYIYIYKQYACQNMSNSNCIISPPQKNEHRG